MFWEPNERRNGWFIDAQDSEELNSEMSWVEQSLLLCIRLFGLLCDAINIRIICLNASQIQTYETASSRAEMNQLKQVCHSSLCMSWTETLFYENLIGFLLGRLPTWRELSSWHLLAISDSEFTTTALNKKQLRTNSNWIICSFNLKQNGAYAHTSKQPGTHRHAFIERPCNDKMASTFLLGSQKTQNSRKIRVPKCWFGANIASLILIF